MIDNIKNRLINVAVANDGSDSIVDYINNL